jgi:hypothetical protein
MLVSDSMTEINTRIRMFLKHEEAGIGHFHPLTFCLIVRATARMMEPRRTCGVVTAAGTEKNVCLENVNARNCLEDLGVGGSMILKRMFYARRLGCSMISNYAVPCIILHIL